MDAARDAWDQTLSSRQRVRLPQRPGHGAGADRHHRLHDGLRHHRHRARHRAHQVQAAGRRRHAQDRQQHGARGAAPSSATTTARRKAIVDYIDDEETIEGAPGLKDEHLPVFDCAFRAANGTRSIHYMGHIRMMAAAQPFLSGAISKTVNLPPDCTVEDIEDAYIESWKLGLKAVAVYRDGCKRTQPLSTSKTDPGLGKAAAARRPRRRSAARRRRCGKQAARRAAVAHAQVLDRRPRGLHPRRPVRDRRAGRDLRAHGQGGLDHLGPDGHLRDRDLAGAAARRAAAAAVSTSSRARASSRRASPEPGDPARQVDHGLPLPLAGVEVREAGRAGGRGRAAAAAPRRSSASPRWSPPRQKIEVDRR